MDMMDCVLPTRNARNGYLYTRQGPLHIKNAEFIDDPRPIDEELRLHDLPPLFARLSLPPVSRQRDSGRHPEHPP